MDEGVLVSEDVASGPPVLRVGVYLLCNHDPPKTANGSGVIEAIEPKPVRILRVPKDAPPGAVHLKMHEVFSA
jgi:hypothetical protein